MVYNMMTCGGFDTAIMGGCSLAWLGLGALFFVAAFLRKWGGEDFGIDFSFLWALIIGFTADILVVTIFGSSKFAFLAGVIGIAAGGYGFGYFGFGGDE